MTIVEEDRWHNIKIHSKENTIIFSTLKAKDYHTNSSWFRFPQQTNSLQSTQWK